MNTNDPLIRWPNLRAWRHCQTLCLLPCLICLGVAGCLESSTGGGSDLRTKLQTLAYIRSAPTDSAGGVLGYHRDRANPGIHVYTAHEDRKAMLLDMEGRTLHTLSDKRLNASGEWDLVESYQQGDFLVLALWQSIMRIDWDSRILWELKGLFHHDLSVAENGDIYALSVEEAPPGTCGLAVPAVFDVLVVVSPAGKLKRELRLAELIEKNQQLVRTLHFERPELMDEKDAFRGLPDPMHTNTIEVFSRDVVIGDRTVFKKGQVLVCVRNMNLVGVVDIDAAEFVWFWGMRELDRPHCPTLLDNNHLLVFDNGDYRGHSRVIELNPATGEIVEQISGESRLTPFRSNTMGEAQRLPNGNTLITSSKQSFAFEMTPDSEIVWVFRALPLEKDPSRKNLPYRLPRIVDARQINEISKRVSLGGARPRKKVSTSRPSIGKTG